MLTCTELTELVTSYLEGRLPLADRVRFDLHLAMCRHCRAYVHQMRDTIQVLGKLPDEGISQDMCDHLLDRFRHWNQ